MGQIIRTNVSIGGSYQTPFNEKFVKFIKTKTGLDWYSLSLSDKHIILSKVIKSCRRCDNCSSYVKILPKYNKQPKIVFIGRAVTAKDIKTMQVISEEHPSYAIIKKITNAFHVSTQDCYYTNVSFCGSPKVNSLTEQNFKSCSYFKELEFLSMEIPDLFILLGNDAFNAFFDRNSSVTSILGNAYVAEYLGKERLFIPLPHPVTLLRDEELYSATFEVVNYYSKVVMKLHGSTQVASTK